MRLLPTLLFALLLVPPARGQAPADAVGAGEFPGLQLLPPGSIVRDISLPRYEGHRVSALFRAKELEVLSRREIRLLLIRAELYALSGETTLVDCQEAQYDFSRSFVTSSTVTSVRDPRFSARGTGVILYTKGNKGLLLGPVHTTLSSSVTRAATHP